MLLVIGVSGVAAGAAFFALPGRPDVGADVLRAGVGVGLLMGGYGAAAVIAGIGIIAGRRWAWWLAVVTILGGLALLGVSITIVGSLDPVLTFGVAVWGVTVALLVAPPTRRSLGVGGLGRPA